MENPAILHLQLSVSKVYSPVRSLSYVLFIHFVMQSCPERAKNNQPKTSPIDLYFESCFSCQMNKNCTQTFTLFWLPGTAHSICSQGCWTNYKYTLSNQMIKFQSKWDQPKISWIFQNLSSQNAVETGEYFGRACHLVFGKQPHVRNNPKCS